MFNQIIMEFPFNILWHVLREVEVSNNHSRLSAIWHNSFVVKVTSIISGDRDSWSGQVMDLSSREMSKLIRIVTVSLSKDSLS